MSNKWVLRSAAFVCALAWITVNAKAQRYGGAPFQSTISAGYSNIQMEHSGGLFYSHDGAYLDGDFEWAMATRPTLFLGFGITGSGYFDNQWVPFPDAFHDQANLYSNLGLFELEPRIGVRLGRRTGLFVTPRIGAGLLIDSYSIDQLRTFNDNTFIHTEDFTGCAFEVRPAVQVGYSWGWSSAGVEASYMYAMGSFGRLGDNAQEVRVGLFYSLRY